MTTDRDDVASDDQVLTIQDLVDHGGPITYSRATVRSILNRLSAAEWRNQELEREIKDHAEWAKRVADPANPEHIPLATKVLALESELAALRQKEAGRVGQSDRECAARICRDYLENGVAYAVLRAVDRPNVAIDAVVKEIASHVAARLRPVEDELREAVKLIRDLQNDMLGAIGPVTWAEDSEMGKKGDPVNMHVAADVRYRIASRSKEKIDTFLARQSTEGE